MALAVPSASWSTTFAMLAEIDGDATPIPKPESTSAISTSGNTARGAVSDEGRPSSHHRAGPENGGRPLPDPHRHVAGDGRERRRTTIGRAMTSSPEVGLPVLVHLLEHQRGQEEPPM